jgi:hypothetical protein
MNESWLGRPDPGQSQLTRRRARGPGSAGAVLPNSACRALKGRPVDCASSSSAGSCRDCTSRGSMACQALRPGLPRQLLGLAAGPCLRRSSFLLEAPGNRNAKQRPNAEPASRVRHDTSAGGARARGRALALVVRNRQRTLGASSVQEQACCDVPADRRPPFQAPRSPQAQAAAITVTATSSCRQQLFDPGTDFAVAVHDQAQWTLHAAAHATSYARSRRRRARQAMEASGLARPRGRWRVGAAVLVGLARPHEERREAELGEPREHLRITPAPQRRQACRDRRVGEHQ